MVSIYLPIVHVCCISAAVDHKKLYSIAGVFLPGEEGVVVMVIHTSDIN